MLNQWQSTTGWLLALNWAEVLHPLWLSLQVALCATLIAIVIGVSFAIFISKTRFKGKELLDTFFLLPMVLPPTVMGYYLLVLIGGNSFIGQWSERVLGIRFIFSVNGAIVAATLVAFPLIYKSARAAFESIPPVYSEVAQNLGANPWVAFWLVTLPLALRGVAAGVMLAFARALGEFGATLMLVGNMPGKTQTLSIAIYQALQNGQDGYALFLTVIICILCIAVLLSISAILRKNVVQLAA